jgi:hypothetical protein
MRIMLQGLFGGDGRPFGHLTKFQLRGPVNTSITIELAYKVIAKIKHSWD